jgi:hypothetical protein
VNYVFFGINWPLSLTSPSFCVVTLNYHFVYSVLYPLILKYLTCPTQRTSSCRLHWRICWNTLTPLFLISSSFVRSHFVSSLKHLTWIMSLIFLSLPSHWYISSYTWPLTLLTAHFVIFFTTLYYSTLWTLLYRCKWLNTLSSHQYHFTHSHFTIMFI